MCYKFLNSCSVIEIAQMIFYNGSLLNAQQSLCVLRAFVVVCRIMNHHRGTGGTEKIINVRYIFYRVKSIDIYFKAFSENTRYSPSQHIGHIAVFLHSCFSCKVQWHLVGVYPFLKHKM